MLVPPLFEAPVVPIASAVAVMVLVLASVTVAFPVIVGPLLLVLAVSAAFLSRIPARNVFAGPFQTNSLRPDMSTTTSLVEVAMAPPGPSSVLAVVSMVSLLLPDPLMVRLPDELSGVKTNLGSVWLEPFRSRTRVAGTPPKMLIPALVDMPFSAPNRKVPADTTTLPVMVPPPLRTRSPVPVLLNPLVPAKGVEIVRDWLMTLSTGWLAPLSRVSGPALPRVQLWVGVVASCDSSVPIVKAESMVTRWSPVRSSVLKSAMAVAPEAMAVPDQFAESLQLPGPLVVHVPLVWACSGERGENTASASKGTTVPRFWIWMGFIAL